MLPLIACTLVAHSVNFHAPRVLSFSCLDKIKIAAFTEISQIW